MPNFYKLSFSQQVLFSDAKVKLYRSGFRDSNPLQLYAFSKGGIDSYRYDNNTWEQTLSMKDLHAQQIYFADVLGNGELMLIAKTQEGISFYQHKNNEFSLLNKTENFKRNTFSSVYGWNKPGTVIKFGYFYHDPNLLGIFTYRRGRGTEVYLVMKDSLKKHKYPIYKLYRDLSILGNSSQAKFALSDLKQNGRENIIVHGNNGLNIL